MSGVQFSIPKGNTTNYDDNSIEIQTIGWTLNPIHREGKGWKMWFLQHFPKPLSSYNYYNHCQIIEKYKKYWVPNNTKNIKTKMSMASLASSEGFLLPWKTFLPSLWRTFPPGTFQGWNWTNSNTLDQLPPVISRLSSSLEDLTAFCLKVLSWLFFFWRRFPLHPQSPP